MKYKMLFIACLIAGAPLFAQADSTYDFTDTARVKSVRPIHERVDHPRRECWDEQVQEREPRRDGDRNLGGTIIGGIAGGLLGSQVGQGNGKTAAAAVGAVTGAVVGDRMANDGSDGGDRYRTRTVQRCRDTQDVQDEVHGYDVTYIYNGRRYTTRLRHDPGNTIRVGITVLDQ